MPYICSKALDHQEENLNLSTTQHRDPQLPSFSHQNSKEVKLFSQVLCCVSYQKIKKKKNW